MSQIIKIEREILAIKINNYYFQESSHNRQSDVHVKAYSHSFIQSEKFKSIETLQLDLTKGENTLLMDMNSATRRQIRRAQERGFQYVVIEHPTFRDLQEFQVFYNNFAKNKKTHTCNFFHMNTMKLLCNQGALKLMYMKNTDEEILCYRVYIIDKDFTMNLYSASHFRMANSSEEKKALGQANRLLIWMSILYFLENGYNKYDMGGLTEDANIRRFKMGFGGEIHTVYSGYEANSLIGRLILKLRDWKMAFHNVSGIQ